MPKRSTPPHVGFEPKFIRMPQSGTLCPYSGLTRSAVDQLIRPQKFNNFDPPVRSRILTNTGSKRQIRLVDFASLMEHISSLPSEGPATRRKRTAA